MYFILCSFCFKICFVFRENARDYYEKASNAEQLVKCYQMLEDYDALEKMVTNLPDKHPLLVQIASVFSSVGMCSQAVSAFVKVSFVCVHDRNSFKKIRANLNTA